MGDKTGIPWQTSFEWYQAVSAIRHMGRLYEAEFREAVAAARRVHSLYRILSGPIDRICSRTCINCRDVCCRHATIWYDLKDLLSAFFASGHLPRFQISKIDLGNGSRACCHFSSHGCRLPRTFRPFICSWYFCPLQVDYLNSREPDLKRRIDRHLSEIKILRDRIESQFIRIPASKSRRSGRLPGAGRHGG